MKRTRYFCALLVGLFALSMHAGAKPLAESKLDTRLRGLAGVPVAIQPQMETPLWQNQDEEVLVSIRLHEDNDTVLQTLRDAGVKIVAHTEGLISATVRASDLLRVASFDFISRLYPVPQPHYFAVEGEQVQSLRADIANADLGIDGSGVKVGMLSNSFAYLSENNPTYVNIGTEENPDFQVVAPPDVDGDGIPELSGTDSQLSGDLPEVVELVREATPWIFNGQDVSLQAYDDEGRALAEVVYDIAPGAELAYYGATGGNADFAQGIRELAEAGCTVIVDDYFSQGSAIYQEDEIRREMRQLEEEYDVVFVTAAGNFGSASVQAAYVDSNPDASDDPEAAVPAGNDLHDWNITLRTPAPDPFLDITMPPQTSATFFLYWENPYSGTLGPGASTDYDLYVLTEPEFDPDNIALTSTNVQGTPASPEGDPFETVRVVNSATDEVLTANLAVNHVHGPAVNFKLIMIGNPRHNVTIQRDVWSTNSFMSIGHPLSPHALTIGAVNYVENDLNGEGLADPRQINPTYYSSRGGEIPQLFDSNGQPMNPVDVIYKPDLASVDGMNTSFFEGSGGDYPFDDEDELPNFLGTSAASPAAAGVIALMRSANPSLTAEEIIQLARSSATDIHSPGFDFYTGHGMLYADDAVNAALNPPTGIDQWEFWTPAP